MRLARLDIRNFRLLRDASIRMDETLTTTVLVGPNDRGETSVAEVWPHWGFRVTNRSTDASVTARRLLASMDAAKPRAFDAMIWTRERGRLGTGMVRGGSNRKDW